MNDEPLAGRDWVMASIHAGFQAGPRRAHRPDRRRDGEPDVDCDRAPDRAEAEPARAYELDLERLFANAVETGTFLEINAQPDRLDLRDVAREGGRRGRREARHLDRRAPGRTSSRTSSSASCRPAAAG